jgi:hypothetical protein
MMVKTVEGSWCWKQSEPLHERLDVVEAALIAWDAWTEVTVEDHRKPNLSELPPKQAEGWAKAVNAVCSYVVEALAEGQVAESESAWPAEFVLLKTQGQKRSFLGVLTFACEADLKSTLDEYKKRRPDFEYEAARLCCTTQTLR